MSADLSTESIFQRGDDATAVRVVLGVRRGHQDKVERQRNLVATNLHIAFLKHIEQTDLDALGEVREFVDGEDATVGAGHEAVMQRELVGEIPTLGHLDRIHFTDQVGD